MYQDLQKKGINSVLLFLIIIQSVFYIVIFPNLEYPDASAHIRKIYIENEDPYFTLMYHVREFIEKQLGIFENITTVRNPDFGYFNWNPINIQGFGNYKTVMIMQSVNVLLIIVSYFLLRYLVLNSNKLNPPQKNMIIRATLIFYAYPAVSYLIVGITPDFLVYLYQPFFIYLIFSKKHLTNIFFIGIIYYFQDDGAMINILFLVIYFFNRIIIRVKGRVSNFLVILGYALALSGIYFISRRFINLFINTDNDILFIMQNSINNYGDLPTKFVNFILSSFYLLGSGSYITFPLIYVIFLYFIFKVIKKSVSSKGFDTIDNLLMTSLITIIMMIILYPPYSHIRFFLFFVYIFILAFFKYVIKDEFLMKEKVYLKIFSFFIIHNIVLILLIKYFI